MNTYDRKLLAIRWWLLLLMALIIFVACIVVFVAVIQPGYEWNPWVPLLPHTGVTV